MESLNKVEVLLNKSKKIFLNKFKKEITLYILDAFKNRSDIKKIEKDHIDNMWQWHFGVMPIEWFVINNWDQYGKTIEKYWMGVKIKLAGKY
jgi:hypothetical protein